MGRTIQLIRGTSAENSNFTGPEGSLAYDTDTGIVRVHDGITKGGISKLLGVLDCMFNDEEYESWYLKLDNQVVIQGGGQIGVNNSNGRTINLPMEMQDTKYNVMLTISHNEVSPAVLAVREVSTRRTTTSINVLTTYATDNSDGYGYYKFKWLVIGRYKN